MMVGRWSAWEVLRRQVALCGRVTSAASGDPVEDAVVRVVDARPGLAERRAGGIYFFLDLPAGTHDVACEGPGAGRRGHGAGDVSWDDKGNVKRAVVDLQLKPVEDGRERASGKPRPKPRERRNR